MLSISISSRIHSSSFLLLLISHTFLLEVSQGQKTQNTLMFGESIKEGQSLVSANKIYELGFFTPAGSTNSYVGIWYHQLPRQTIVWVANRERPVSDSSGVITIDTRGTLVISDSKGTIFSSNTKGSNQTVAKLMDSGNFVLKPSKYSQEFLWQSFDHPTDTFLPGMMLNGQNQVITSWRNLQDPAPGAFSLGLDPNETYSLLFGQTGQTSNRLNFSLILEMVSHFYNFSYVPLWNPDNYSYSIDDRFTISRGIMEVSGQFKQLTWFQDSKEWVAFLAEPKKFPCEVPSYCGFNGLCANDSSSPPCTCLSGFQPSSHDQWESNNWSGGCVRRAALLCGEGDGFLKLTSTKLPIFQTDIQNSSLILDDCKAKCVKNCSCTAYASANANGTGCLLWFGDLLGLQENYDGGQDVYVRLVASELNQFSDHGKKSLTLIIILVITGTIGVLLPGAAILCCKYGKAIGKKQLRNQELSSNPGLRKLPFADVMMHGEDNKGCPHVSFAEIAAATDNFSDLNKLGEGGFGPVYKGMLGGYTVAVKRLAKNSGQGNREFKNEITLIANLQHRNLVRLLGCCIEQEEKILIYEYLPNKSLDTYIFDTIRGADLDWQKRFHTIEGIAQGLLYLHNFSRLKVIHRDLKTSNILLDSEMNPKISDFGLARIFAQNENQANTRRVVGTYGYMSPEYAMEGLFSVKSDIYSFGVMLLEIVSGKKNTSFQHSDTTVNLLGYAWELWTEGRGLELVDPILGDLYPPQEVSRCIHVALLCVQDHAADRPNISAVISMLHNQTCVPFPKQPAFYFAREEGLSACKLEIYSLNNASFTSIQGR